MSYENKANVSINIDIAGFQGIQLEDEVKSSNIVVVLDDTTKGKLYEYYTNIKKFLTNGNRIYLVVVKDETDIDKSIETLCITYDNYDIYEVDDRSRVTEGYVQSILERNPTIEEVETFVSSNSVAYSRISDILCEIDKAIKNDDIEQATEVIYNNKDLIEQFPPVFDYMKKSVDIANMGIVAKVEELEKEKIGLLDQAATKSAEIEEHKNRANELEKKINELNSEIEDNKKNYARLENEIKSTGKMITMYSPLKLNSIKTGVRAIIYFKEITPVQYINTLVTSIHDYVSTILRMKTKLIIYDQPGDFSQVYTPIPIIDNAAYFRSCEDVKSVYPKVVFIETNPVYISDILKSHYEVIIIYDRLKKNTNIVDGSIVNQFNVIGSLSHIVKLESQGIKMDKSRIITNLGSCKECISIPTIQEYKTKSKAAKLTAYAKLMNVGENNGKVMDIILGQSGLINRK